MPDALASYLERIRRLTPSLEIRDARLNSEGLVNDVVIINDAVVYRIARDKNGEQLLAHETNVLRLVSDHVSLSVPRFELLAPDVVTYPFLRSEPLSRETILHLPSKQQNAVAAQLGEFLAQLNAIPSQTLIAHNIRRAPLRSPTYYESFYADLQRELMPLLMHHQKTWLDDIYSSVWNGTLDFSFTPALTHGDLGAYHILYDPTTQRLCGVLDFGEASINDPADDIANLINGLGESIVARLAPCYLALDCMLDRARFYAVNLELQWLLSGLRSDDRSWFAVHLGRARDIQPLGVK